MAVTQDSNWNHLNSYLPSKTESVTPTGDVIFTVGTTLYCHNISLATGIEECPPYGQPAFGMDPAFGGVVCTKLSIDTLSILSGRAQV